MIVDSHVHFQPPRLAEAVREFFARNLAGDLLVYSLDHRQTLHSLAAAGVSVVWNLPYAHKPGVARGLNEASAEFGAARLVSEVAVVGGATVHAGDAHPERVVGRALDDLGLRVVKLHCSVGDYEPDDERFDAMWELLQRRAVPAIVHAGHGIDGTTQGAELRGLEAVATKFPGVPLIIAHTAHPATRAALALIHKHPNVYADLTPCVTDAVDLTDEELEAHADRILFGSDAPNTAVRVQEGIARVRRLSAAAQAAIFSGNASRLLGT